MLGRVIAAVLVAAGICSTASAQDVKLPEIDFGRYHALVIGNNDYQHLPKLNTAVVDAVAVAEVLRLRYGFEAKLLINATRLAILEALNAYRRDLTERDNLLIYYAGHGVLDQETDTGFWLPVDAKADSDSFWIPNADLSRRLRAVSARHVLVVADSCYSGTLVRDAAAPLPTGGERTAWVERMNRLASRTALVSGGLEPVLDSGGGNHSVFAKAFLDVLRGNNEVLDGQALYRTVSRPVVLNAPDQTPRYSDIRLAGHEGGEFLFVPRDVGMSASVAPEPPQPTGPGASTFELTFWQSIQSSRNPGDFEAYLRKFPRGTFADLARNRLRSLKQAQTALVLPPKPEFEIDPIEAEYVAAKNANVRAEPTVRSAKVTTLKRGTSVHVAGKVKDQNWFLVERDDKPLGYVYGELLQDAQSLRQEEKMRRKSAELRKAEEARQQEEKLKRVEEAKRQAEERRNADQSKQREEERERREEARQVEERVEQSRIALAPPPKPQTPSPTQKEGGTLADGAEERLRQDAYEKIMSMALGSRIGSGLGKGKQNIGKTLKDVYRKEKQTKVLASCIFWHGNSVGDLKIGTWWTRYKNFGSRSNLSDLRRGAINNCKSSAKGKKKDCKCQIVDENEKNSLKLPKEWKERVLASREGNLRSANLEGTSFRNANLQGFNFEGANLQKANLSGARLQKANLDGANLVNAYLQIANLQGASIRNANFRMAMLNGADLLGANFQGADLSEARGLKQEQLDKACGDENTKLPKDLTIKPCPKDGE